MVSRKASLLLALTLGIPAANAHAERPSQIDATRTDTVELSHRFARGASHAWNLSVVQQVEGLQNTRMRSADASLAAVVRYEVQSVESAAGTATLTTSITEPTLELSVNGTSANASPSVAVLRAARISQRVRPDGTIEERTQLPAADPSGADLSAIVTDLLSYAWIQYPAETLRIGDAWVQSVPTYHNDPQNGVQASATIRYRHAGYALHNGAEHIVLEATWEITTDGIRGGRNDAAQSARIVGRGHGDGYALVHPTRGSVSELGLDLGYVLTVTEANGRRAVETTRTQATLTARGSAETVATP